MKKRVKVLLLGLFICLATIFWETPQAMATPNMQRNVVVVSGEGTTIVNELQKRYNLASEFQSATGDRTQEVDTANILYVDAEATGKSEIIGNKKVQTALERGIPIVISKPSAQLTTSIAGVGSDALASIIVQGKGRYAYLWEISDADNEIDSALLEFQTVEETSEESEQESGIIDISASTGEALTKKELAEALVSVLEKTDIIENHLAELALNSWASTDDIPPNRMWSVYEDFEWQQRELSDPSGEQSKTQTPRFRISATFRLLAADQPVKKKVLRISVGGVGFEPFQSGEGLIRNDTKHRGWAQAMTYVQFTPNSNFPGSIEDYVPVNEADVVSISSGFDWSIGLEASDPPSVSFSYSKSSTNTKQSKDFRTLTESLGDNGMLFYHNAYMVDGDTTIDARNLFASEWNDDMSKMFYDSIDGKRVRAWPTLSLQLLKPNSETVWYADSTENSTSSINIQAVQGLVYAYTKIKSDIIHSDRHIISFQLPRSKDSLINYSFVTYNP